MSPRAAWRLETLGFKRVYDYVGGKLDWMACGLPMEGKSGDSREIIDFVESDVPTCSLSERLDDVRKRVGKSSFRSLPVINDEKIVIGLVPELPSGESRDLSVEDVMDSGPKTFRANTLLDDAVDYLAKNNEEEALVTTSGGMLLGILQRDTAERAAKKRSPGK